MTNIKKKYLHILLIFFILALKIESNANGNDSLKSLLNQSIGDSSRAFYSGAIGFEYLNTNRDSALYYLRLSYQLATDRKYNPILANTCFSLGLYYEKNEMNDSAAIYFIRSAKIKEEIRDKNRLELIYRKLGEIYLNSSAFEIAMDYSRKALSLSIDAKDTLSMIDNFRLAGIIFQKRGILDNAEDYLYRSLKLAEKYNAYDDYIQSYLKIGELYFSKKDFEKSMISFNAAFKKANEKNQIMNLILSGVKISEVHFALGDYREAIAMYDSILVYTDSVPDLELVGSIYFKLANVYQAQGNFPKALDNYYRSMKFYREGSNRIEIINLYAAIGQTYMEQNNVGKAYEYYERAKDLAQRLNSVPNLVEIYYHLANLYERWGDTSRAYTSLKLFAQYKDTIFNLERVKLMNNMEMLRKNEILEIETQRADDKNHFEALQARTAIIATMVGLILTVLIIIAFINRNKERQETDSLLVKYTTTLETQNNELELIRGKMLSLTRDMSESATYAETIQTAILPDPVMLRGYFKDVFLLCVPRDIVSGDFHWFYKTEEANYIAVADCTGHGVPGAFMTIIGIMLLNSTMRENPNSEPEQILEFLDKKFIEALKQDDKHSYKSGEIEIALVKIKNSGESYPEITFAGAKRPLLYSINNELFEIKGSRFSIGGVHKNSNKHFKQHNVQYNFMTDFANEHRLTLYLTSDGLANLMSPEQKKYGIKNVKSILEESSNLTLEEQALEIEKSLYDHKQYEDQTDDITILGIRVV